MIDKMINNLFDVDWNDPISMSALYSVGVFIVSFAVLYKFTPHFVQENSEYESESEKNVDKYKVFLYSVLFGLATGLGHFFMRKDRDDNSVMTEVNDNNVKPEVKPSKIIMSF